VKTWKEGDCVKVKAADSWAYDKVGTVKEVEAGRVTVTFGGEFALEGTFSADELEKAEPRKARDEE